MSESKEESENDSDSQSLDIEIEIENSGFFCDPLALIDPNTNLDLVIKSHSVADAIQQLCPHLPGICYYTTVLSFSFCNLTRPSQESTTKIWKEEVVKPSKERKCFTGTK